MPPTGDLARNPGMCPDQELNQCLEEILRVKLTGESLPPKPTGQYQQLVLAEIPGLNFRGRGWEGVAE